MKMSSRYVKIVEWSDEDQCYVGSCPGLFYSGCHGDNEQEVFSNCATSLKRQLNYTDETAGRYLHRHPVRTMPTKC